jgi:glutathione S-transferase
MPIQVYGIAMSTCTQRVLTTLIEKGLKYELLPVDFAAGEQKVKLNFCFESDYLKMNFNIDSKISRRKTTIWCCSCTH